jgi:hypothetical protein
LQLLIAAVLLGGEKEKGEIWGELEAKINVIIKLKEQMPIRLKDIEKYGVPIYFQKKREVMVRVGPCSATFMQADKIPLDGRYYICAGTIILKNGMNLQAHFEINTHTYDFLERESVRIYIDKEEAWYSTDEAELYEILGVKKADALPYTWLPDIPLDYSDKGPYQMFWHKSES